MENKYKIPKQIKIFCMTFIAMFLIVTLQRFGFHLPLSQFFKIPIHLVSPLPEKPDVLFDLLPQLEKKKIKFELKKDLSLVQQSFASNELEADSAHAYAIIDLDTGQILAEKNGDNKFPIASITKIMTAVTALDLADPDELFTISKSFSKIEPTKIGLTRGEKATLTELLNGALLFSGNDAAQAVSDGIDEKYNAKIFIRAMNEKANFLGLHDSHFTNPQGFDNGNNYSTAHDVARLTQYALTQYPLINDIVKQDYLEIPANENHKEFKMVNWNGLIGVYPETQGVKIGYTGDAGRTTVVVSNRENKKILVVLLGAPGILERDLWTAQLLDFGYEKELGLDPVNVTEDQLREKYATWYN